MRTAEAIRPATTFSNNSSSFNRESGRDFFGRNGGVDPFFKKQNAPSIQTKPSRSINAYSSVTQTGSGHSPNAASIQTKLTIGQPGDKYEQEADAMADNVVQRLGEHGTVQTRPDRLSDSFTPFIQAKCTACEEDDKLQKKEEDEELPDDSLQLKPIFESDAKPQEDEIQRKCADCAEEELQLKCADCEEEEKVQKKASGHENEMPGLLTKPDQGSQTNSSGLESHLSGTRGSGSPLPETTRSSMESAFNTNFSNVNIHTGSQAKNMNKSLHAQAFTHGSDIYFNEGKYNPGTQAGQHLLAHELTHVVQQRSGIKRKSNVTTTSSSVIPDVQLALPLAPVVVWGGRYLAGRLIRWGISKALESEQDMVSLGVVIRQQLLKFPVDLMGQTKFSPPAFIANHIKAFSLMADWFRENKSLAPLFGEKFRDDIIKGPKINIKYGSLGSRQGVPVRWHDASSTYEMDPHFMEMEHPAFKTDDRIDTTYLGVGVDRADSSVYGGMALLPKGLLPSAVNKESMRFLMSEGLLTGLVFGNDYDNEQFNRIIYINDISGGQLIFMLSGYYDIAGQQTLAGAFVLLNNSYSWSGNLRINVNGIVEREMPVERDTRSRLSGILPDMQLDKDWNFNNIKASLNASYMGGLLEIRGKASYEPKEDDDKETGKASRIKKAEITLLVTTEEKAWEEVRQQLPSQDEDGGNYLPALYESGDRLTLVGWGSLDVVLVRDKEGKDYITGQAGLVLDPKGHITVIGTIRLKPRYELMEAKGIPDWKPVSPKLTGKFGPIFVKFPGFPAGVNFTGSGGLYYKYILGPVTLYDITIQGLYSTNPDIHKELSVSARLNLSAELNGKVMVTGRMAARVGTSFPYLGFDLSAVELVVSGEASLPGYFDIASTLGVREQTEDGGKIPRLFIKGIIDLAGELSLGLEAKLKLEVLYGDLLDETISGNWPVANAGVAIDFDYNIGDELSEEKLGEIVNFKKTRFDRAKFVKGVLKEKMPKETGDIRGGFKDEKGKKIGEVSDQPIPIPEKTITPVKVKDDFNMEGVWHYLEMEVGAPGQAVVLKMSTTPKELAHKIRTHRDKAVLLQKTSQNEDDKEWLGRMIADLDKLQNNASELIHRAQRLGLDPDEPDKKSFPGFEALGDQISLFGRRYNLTDLGSLVSGTPDGNKPSKDIGDGTYDFPIHIRWVKRGYHSPISLTPLKVRWTRFKKKPPSDVTASFNSLTPIEVPPTQKRSFSEEVVYIGVAPKYQARKELRIKRVKSPKKRPMVGKFRTLLTNYNYDWSGSDADHSLDLGWGGKDVLNNLWPLYREMNQEYGNTVYGQIVRYIENGEIKEGKPRTLIGKWFIITGGIGDLP
jgi:hypothetical protein